MDRSVLGEREQIARDGGDKRPRSSFMPWGRKPEIMQACSMWPPEDSVLLSIIISVAYPVSVFLPPGFSH